MFASNITCQKMALESKMWGSSNISKYTSYNNGEVYFLQFRIELDRDTWSQTRFAEIEKDCILS